MTGTPAKSSTTTGTRPSAGLIQRNYKDRQTGTLGMADGMWTITMAIEYERRFLASDPQAALAGSKMIGWADIRQGYLGRAGGLSLRVRSISHADGKRTGLLSRKGRRHGTWREEYEAPLSTAIAEQVLGSLSAAQIIHKRRYHLCHQNMLWCLDFFSGSNTGLVIAEVELLHAGQSVELPNWVGQEITYDRRYGNSYLARSPIQEWPIPIGVRCRERKIRVVPAQGLRPDKIGGQLTSAARRNAPGALPRWQKTSRRWTRQQQRPSRVR